LVEEATDIYIGQRLALYREQPYISSAACETTPATIIAPASAQPWWKMININIVQAIRDVDPARGGLYALPAS